MPIAGERIDNFTLADRLGANAFGEVWSARESITERLVRLNFLRGNSDYEVARFTRAISLLSRLNHPSIVAHTGHGFYRHRPYLATEHVQGPTLASLMANGGGRMDELRVLRIAAQIAEGLDHAWRTAEIIHRNLGPETILVDLASLQEEGEVRVKLIDFGHALGKRLVDQYDREQMAEEESFQRAAQEERVGTLLTMPPEQIRGARLTVGCDMYALGVTMHLLLSGAPPFTGSDEELATAHLRTPPLDLQQVVPGIQPATAVLVRRLLSKDADGRFPDWATLRGRLQPLIDPLERLRPARQQPSTETVRKTVTYESSPQGSAVPGWIAGGGVAGRGGPGGGVPAPPSGRAPDERALFAVLAARLASTAPTPPAEREATDAPAPSVDDGLNAEQRAAVWAYLFRNPAILEASVAAPAQPTEPTPLRSGIVRDPTPGRVPTLGESPARGMPRVERAQAEVPPTEPATPAEEEPAAVEESSAPSFAELFAVQAPTAPTAQPHTGRHTADAPQTPRNPSQSPLWKVAIEQLRTTVVGRVRYKPGSEVGITKRFTTSLRRLVGSRESMIEEVGKLLDAGRFDEADKQLDKLAVTAAKSGQAGNDAQMCLLRARMLVLRNDPANALRWAQNAVQQKHPDPAALALVGWCHLQARRTHAAMAIFDEAARVHPESALGPIGQATILILAGMTDRADEALDEAERRPPHVGTVRTAALLARAEGDVAGEIAQLERLLTGTSADWEVNERIEQLGGRTRGKTVVADELA